MQPHSTTGTNGGRPDAEQAYRHEQRVLVCDRCGAPVEAARDAGQVSCGHCGAGLEVRMRIEAAAAPSTYPSEEARLAALAEQDRRFLPPAAIAQLFAGERIAPTREQEAWQSWQGLRRALRSAADYDAAEQLFFLTLGLAELTVEHGQPLRQRALIDSALEVLNLPRHQQLLRAQLARGACRAGAPKAAEAWLATCDAASGDLHADTAYRFARAYLDTAAGELAKVVHVLGGGRAIALSNAYDAECTVLRANAWERQGQVAVAVDDLLRLDRELGPLARGRAQRFIAAHRAWQLCAQSAPAAQQQAAGFRPAPLWDPAIAAKLLLTMAIFAGLWLVVGIAGWIVAGMAADDVGHGGFVLSIASGGLMAALLGGLGVFALMRAKERTRALERGQAHGAHVLTMQSRPDPMYGPENVLELDLSLLITPLDGPAYPARTKTRALPETMARFAPGSPLVVRIDPQRPAEIAVDID
ncbi:MAG: hypothetical protein JRI23_36070 [Deltaproteobacteria bacterium]|jgi:DNA-directed RNA polymerase subunit RPC12/RpoP|nr:hypothetical protein [Deltaproteobacteria bacterium]MBW2537767.1 hypothetical protein [Deltaproteobacteria bacterium]